MARQERAVRRRHMFRRFLAQSIQMYRIFPGSRRTKEAAPLAQAAARQTAVPEKMKTAGESRAVPEMRIRPLMSRKFLWQRQKPRKTEPKMHLRR